MKLINALQLWQSRMVRRFLPTPGNVFFTLLIVVLLVWVRRTGALVSPAGISTDTIAYQGRLTDANANPLSGTYNMIFRLYNVASGGSPLWTEQWSGSSAIQVSDGLFNVLLGSLTPIPQTIFTDNSTLWLGLKVGTDNEMTPRVEIGSVPYAVQGFIVPDDSITTDKIVDGAVTQEKAPTLIRGLDSDERVEYGMGTWSGAWAQNPAGGTWFRTTTVTFATPFSTPPIVIATFSSGDPEAWAAVASISTQGFTAQNIAVVQIPNTDPDTFTWIAIGK
ncbi:MAG: H-type lectin domain-containing protein [Chloroflexi bacterium]|nr:H-type lectin domain-containing protein [Chloroflexota bacterium]